MKCVICGDVARLDRDERLPLLRVRLCSSCRDVIAYSVGWCRRNDLGRGAKGASRLWSRRGVVAEVTIR